MREEIETLFVELEKGNITLEECKQGVLRVFDRTENEMEEFLQSREYD
jgi:hypothetical protein